MASPVRFAVAKKMFEDHGWHLARVRGSHHIFSAAMSRFYLRPSSSGNGTKLPH